jgi:alkanesulfonate monooxygenase
LRARAARFDAILLDRSMNKLDGLSVLKTLREEGLETPIMFLTAAGRLEDRVHGLEAGADDYMAKPFELAELIARARALTRRTARLALREIIAGDVRLDLISRRAAVRGAAVKLTAQDFDILEALVRQGELRQAADADGYVEENLWTGIGQARSGAGAAIVGDPDQVLAKLDAYRALGIEAFILSGYPHQAAGDLFARYVLPKIAHAPLESTKPN